MAWPVPIYIPRFTAIIDTNTAWQYLAYIYNVRGVKYREDAIIHACRYPDFYHHDGR